MANKKWVQELHQFYKIENKFSQNADLIKRVISKVDRDVVTPMEEVLKFAAKELRQANPRESEWMYRLLQKIENVLNKS